MSTLLIPLVGPLQSWGLDARFGERLTAQEPTKSGVLGLVCAALGRDRAEPVDDLAALRMGVRVDRAGTLLRDYQTALDVASAGTRDTGTVLSNRWYLADAAFLVGLEGEPALLGAIHLALANPRWPVFLGRKACVPAMPLAMPGAVVDAPLTAALRSAAPLPAADATEPARLVVEDPLGPQTRPDQPIAPFSVRRFAARRVKTETMTWNLPASS